MNPLKDLITNTLVGELAKFEAAILGSVNQAIDDAKAKAGAGSVSREIQKSIMAVGDPKSGAPLDVRVQLMRGAGDLVLAQVGGIGSPLGNKIDAFVVAAIGRENTRGTAQDAQGKAAREAADHAMDEAFLALIRAAGAHV